MFTTNMIEFTYLEKTTVHYYYEHFLNVKINIYISIF